MEVQADFGREHEGRGRGMSWLEGMRENLRSATWDELLDYAEQLLMYAETLEDLLGKAWGRLPKHEDKAGDKEKDKDKKPQQEEKLWDWIDDHG